ncbi:MAG: hypothetical protein FJZ58_00325 [Chlamydiae bacterium]|nr:hypothetical protein [Chlamydiota bacterium]
MEQTTQELKVTWTELASLLTKEGNLDLREGHSLIIHQIDTNDLISVVEESEPAKRLSLLIEVMKRFSLEVGFEGSLNLGPFNLSDHSWTLTPGNTNFVRIVARPLTVRKNITELVSFLCKLPVGQALVLKPNQKLFLEDLPNDALISYYQTCQASKDLREQEQEQDALFCKSCPELEEKNLLLKIYGLQVSQINRNIDTNAEGILFIPVGGEERKEPRLVLGLVAKQAPEA